MADQACSECGAQPQSVIDGANWGHSPSSVPWIGEYVVPDQLSSLG
jgi:hypothetical protein